MPTFCRHGRFIERCPVCSPPAQPGTGGGSGAGARSATRSRSSTGSAGARRSRPDGLRVRREGRATEDGYSCELVPGLRASADAERLAEEIAFSAERLAALAIAPPGLYGEASELRDSDPERAIWICWLSSYLCPTDGEDPFASIRRVLAEVPPPSGQAPAFPETPELPADLELGPRSAHDPARGGATLIAYGEWVARAATPSPESAGPGAGPQARALEGDPGWTPQRRFERLYERLSLPGMTRAARFELLVVLGRLGLIELVADGLHLGSGRGVDGREDSVEAAKRVFGIAEPMLLERRSTALAQAGGVPLEALDLALANWGRPSGRERALMGTPGHAPDPGVIERLRAALEL